MKTKQSVQDHGYRNQPLNAGYGKGKVIADTMEALGAFVGIILAIFTVIGIFLLLSSF